MMNSHTKTLNMLYGAMTLFGIKNDVVDETRRTRMRLEKERRVRLLFANWCRLCCACVHDGCVAVI